MEKPDSDIIRKLIEKFEFREKFERIYIKYKDKKEPVDFIAIFFAIIAGMVSLIAFFGIVVGLIASILIICIGLYIFRYLRIRSKASEDAKRHISNDLEKNVHNKRTRKFPIGKVIKIFIILLVFSLLYVNFHTYFVDPEITITSPRAGDVVKIDKDNTFHKISGNSKGLANNQFLHLFVLYRRVDSNQEPDVWNCDYDLLRDHCTIYNDGRWECRIQLNELFKECVNETLFVKSPTNSSNNISINVDIVTIITKQSIMHSVFTKLKTRYLQVLNEVDGPDWYKLMIFFLPTGKGTFYDRFYDFYPAHYDSYWDYSSRYSVDDQVSYGSYYHLPKHLADDHVTITPLIIDYPCGRCVRLGQPP